MVFVTKKLLKIPKTSQTVHKKDIDKFSKVWYNINTNKGKE